MYKGLKWMCLLMIGSTQVFAQYSAAPPKQAVKPAITTTKPATQKLPSPYLLKKDFEAKMQEVNASINNAVNSSSALKAEVADKLNKIGELDQKMQSVEQILNSANFQIATTSDSLKKTQYSIEEFRKETENTIAQLEARDEQMIYIWTGMGILLLLSATGTLYATGKSKKLKSDLRVQSEQFKSKLSDELAKQQLQFADELRSLKAKIQEDLSNRT